MLKNIIVISSVTYLISALLVCGLIALVNFRSNQTQLKLRLSETRIISVSSRWHSGIEFTYPTLIDHGGAIQNTSRKFVQLMKFNHKLALSAEDQYSNHFYTSFKLDYTMGPYFLHPNSTLHFQWNIPPNPTYIEIALIKSKEGKDKFLSCKKEERENNNHREPPPSKFIVFHEKTNESFTEFTRTINEEENYYVIFYSSSPNTNEASIKYTIYSRLYNTSDPADSCALPCSMSVPFNAQHTTLVLVTPSANSFVEEGYGSVNAQFSFSSNLLTRKNFTGAIIGSSLVGLLFVLLTIIFIAWRKYKRNYKRNWEYGLLIQH